MINCKLWQVFLVILAIFFGGIHSGYSFKEDSPLFWPPPPADMRLAFVKSIYSAGDIGIKPGLFAKLKGVLFGGDKNFLNKPVAVALNKKGDFYVCDIADASIHVFMPSQKRYDKIINVGGQRLLSPVAVAISDSGLIFVADSQLNKVFCLDSHNRLKFMIGQESGLERPTGLAIAKDRLYLTDTQKHCIFIFDLAGNFIFKIGARGGADGLFNYPTLISVDSKGRIYVADTLNFRIQVFGNNGQFLFAIGQLGDSSGSFARPKGVAVDSYGHIYITDALFDNMQIFNQAGKFLLSVGEAGGKDGEFWIPSGIAIDKDNYIYVADSYNRRIQVFHYVGKE